MSIFIGGIAVEHDHLNLQMLKRFQSALNQPDFADIGEDTMKMRMIKSTEEHELYRKTARIADMGGKFIVHSFNIFTLFRSLSPLPEHVTNIGDYYRRVLLIRQKNK